MVQSQLNEVKSVMNDTVELLSTYLNRYSINDMLKEEGSKSEGYYKSLLKALRRLEVFCDEAHDAVHMILKSKVIQQGVAEKTLYGIYHQCIMEFYAPKEDVWFENSRAAYTGKSSITYHHPPPVSFQILIRSLEKGFQQLRVELAYYENEYPKKESPS